MIIIFVVCLLSVPIERLYGQQKYAVRSVEAEIGVGLISTPQKLNFVETGTGVTFYTEGRYNFANVPVDAGLYFSGSIFHRVSENIGSLYFKSFNIMAVSDYNLFKAQKAFLFAGAGVGLCICDISYPINFDDSSRNKWKIFETGGKKHSLSVMPRLGVEFFHHLRLTMFYKMQEKANRYFGVTMSYVFGVGPRRVNN